ncbi:hypothetical protein [Gemmata sp.]|uniref:hypothetical protein n=1 Tax=Gemmata sp. TaxID=1914242 RepID=UPI003F6EA90E
MGGDVTVPGCAVEPLVPFGVLVRPTGGPRPVPSPAELRELVLRDRVVVCRGFTPEPTQHALAAYAAGWGSLLQWDFGTVFEVVEHEAPKNYLFASGSVPYHWDGAFAERVPWLQVFQQGRRTTWPRFPVAP